MSQQWRGFALAFAIGGQHVYIYGREPHVASAADTLTIDEAKALAQEMAGALTTACVGGTRRAILRNGGRMTTSHEGRFRDDRPVTRSSSRWR